MSFQEDQESQIYLTLQQRTDGRESSPSFDPVNHAPTYCEPCSLRNGNGPGSGDTEFGENASPISSPQSRHEGLQSQVEETQFVLIERDTQPSIDYDISPTTRRVLENTKLSLAKSPPPIMAMQLLERPEILAISDSTEFRFAKPPNTNNMKLARPPPGVHRPGQPELTSRDKLVPSEVNLNLVNHTVVPSAREPVADPEPIQRTPSTAIRSLLNHGSSSEDTFIAEEIPDSALPDTQTESTNSPDQATNETSEDVGVGSLKLQFRAEPISSSRSKTMESLQRNSSRLFERAQLPANSIFRAGLSATMESNNSHVDNDPLSPSRPTRQAKSGPPPFIEAALSSDIRTSTAGCPATAITSATTTVQSTESDAAVTAEVRGLKPKRTASRPVAESARIVSIRESSTQINPYGQTERTVQTLSDVAIHERPHHDDIEQPTTSEKRFPEVRNVSLDLSENHRPRSRNKNFGGAMSRQGTVRLPSDRPATRPLPDGQLQTQDLCVNQILHSTRDSGVSKRVLSRANSPCHIQSSHAIPIGGNEQVNAAGLLHMATVMLTAEKEQLNNVVAEAKLQSAQIDDLTKENATLHDRIKHLSKDNQLLLTKSTGFRKRYEQCKAKMNDIMKIQRELKVDAKNLDRRQFEVLKAAGREMDADILEAKSQVFKNSRAILNEARLELHRQNQRIDLLNRDINNQLLDLQRERGQRENLQKQLENREKQQEELKSVLFDHQRTTVATLSDHEDILKCVLNAGAESTLMLTECRALIKSLNESERKPIPALIELNELVIALSTSVERKLQTAEDGTIHIRDAGIEVLAELKHRLKMISEDQMAQQKLNVIIAGLGEENAKLEERIQNREEESLGVRNQLNDVQQELQKCRAQLSITNEDLGKAIAASREDALLRTQLQDLQTSYSIAKQQAESSAREAERIRVDLHEQENSTLLSQQENGRLQDKLQKSEAMVSSFDDEKKAYVRQLIDESNILRVQMERDFRARLAEDEAHHNGIFSGLRRQVIEADNKLTQAQQKLQDAEKVRTNKEMEIQTLSEKLSAVATEVGSLQHRACLMEYTRDRVDSELRVSQEQIMQYLKKDADWSARAEENALEFAKRRKDIDDWLNKSENASEYEVNRLGQLVSELQKKNEDFDIAISKIVPYLRNMGVLRPDLALIDWALGLPGEGSKPEANMSPLPQSVAGEHYHVHGVSQESYNGGFRSSVGSSNVSVCNQQAETSAKFGSEGRPLVTNPPPVLSNEDRGTRLTEIENQSVTSFSESTCRESGRDIHQLEHYPSKRSLESPSTSKIFSDAPNPFTSTKSSSRVDLHASEQFYLSNTHFSGNKKLKGTAQIVIADSQEVLPQGIAPTFAPPPRRVAERQHSLVAGNRTITRTEIKGFSVRTSETYVGTPGRQNGDMAHLPCVDQPNDLRAADSDEESSGLSEPPENVDRLDLAEFMDTGDGADRKGSGNLKFSDKMTFAESMASHSVLAPRPNSSRMRARPPVRRKDTKQPKSILKRTNSAVQANDTIGSTKPSERTSGNSQLDMPGLRGGVAVNKRLSRTMSGTNGRDVATHRSPYNRPVAGYKDLHKSSHFQAQNVPHHEQGPSIADNFNISSSPVMGQPQRNSKKRALSGVGINDNNRPIKLPRGLRH